MVKNFQRLGRRTIKKEKLEDNQYFNSDFIRKIWGEHLTEKRNWQYPSGI